MNPGKNIYDGKSLFVVYHMNNFLTKSLFVEFATNPHIARWHVHDKNVYKQILDAIYGSMDGMAVGKAVEQQVAYLLHPKQIKNVETMERSDPNWYRSYHKNTMQAISEQHDCIYQAGVCFDNLFVKVDYLIKNTEGKYELWEVKAKNTVRKKSETTPLIDDICADISFQHFVLQKVLGEKYANKAYVVYLNKEYIRQGDINPAELILKEDVTAELWNEQQILEKITEITKTISLPREQFIQAYPYSGEDHLSFFGEKSETGTIWHIPQIRDGKGMLYHRGIKHIANITDEELLLLQTDKHEETRATKYIRLWQQGDHNIDKETIHNIFATLQFPLYFYDYETISRPVPLLQGTKPRQQVVVQYSLHKMYEDGRITHSQDIIQPGENTNRRVIDHLMQDLGTDAELHDGTYVVWYKGFENTRNLEIAGQYPQYEEICQYINDHTFDLMELFSELHYFHRDFHGSASIKKVLPVLTDITYDDLEISHGALAAEVLMNIVTHKYDPQTIKEKTDHLLKYCTQDTLAMVSIYERVKNDIFL